MSGRNLVVNGSFCRGTDNSPAGWTPDPYRPTASLTWDQHVGHHDHRSVRISDTTQPTDSRWDQTVAVQPNTQYRLEGWIKTNDVSHTAESVDAGANLSLLGVPDLTFDHSLPALFGTNDWTHVVMDFNTGSSTQVTVTARLGIFVGTVTGTAWFDDIRLVQLPLLVNGSFRRGTDNSPAGWTPDPYRPTASLTWDQHVGHNDHRSVRISDTTQPTDSRWDQTVAVQPNTQYRLEGWIKTNDVSHTAESVDAGANLSLLGVPDLTFDHSLPALFGTNDWTHVVMDFNTGSSTQVTVTARLGIFVGTVTGTAWFDDICLTPLS